MKMKVMANTIVSPSIAIHAAVLACLADLLFIFAVAKDS